MRITKLAAAALLGISALGLSACATGLRTEVSRYQAMPAPQGQSFFIIPAGPADTAGLEFSRYAGQVAQAMQAQGYAQAPSLAAATMVVRLDYGVDEALAREAVADEHPRERRPRDRVDRHHDGREAERQLQRRDTFGVRRSEPEVPPAALRSSPGTPRRPGS